MHPSHLSHLYRIEPLEAWNWPANEPEKPIRRSKDLFRPFILRLYAVRDGDG